jgi:hypothetical protein
MSESLTQKEYAAKMREFAESNEMDYYAYLERICFLRYQADLMMKEVVKKTTPTFNKGFGG